MSLQDLEIDIAIKEKIQNYLDSSPSFTELRDKCMNMQDMSFIEDLLDIEINAMCHEEIASFTTTLIEKYVMLQKQENDVQLSANESSFLKNAEIQTKLEEQKLLDETALNELNEKITEIKTRADETVEQNEKQGLLAELLSLNIQKAQLKINLKASDRELKKIHLIRDNTKHRQDELQKRIDTINVIENYTIPNIELILSRENQEKFKKELRQFERKILSDKNAKFTEMRQKSLSTFIECLSQFLTQTQELTEFEKTALQEMIVLIQIYIEDNKNLCEQNRHLQEKTKLHIQNQHEISEQIKKINNLKESNIEAALRIAQLQERKFDYEENENQELSNRKRHGIFALITAGIATTVSVGMYFLIAAVSISLATVLSYVLISLTILSLIIPVGNFANHWYNAYTERKEINNINNIIASQERRIKLNTIKINDLHIKLDEIEDNQKLIQEEAQQLQENKKQLNQQTQRTITLVRSVQVQVEEEMLSAQVLTEETKPTEAQTNEPIENAKKNTSTFFQPQALEKKEGITAATMDTGQEITKPTLN